MGNLRKARDVRDFSNSDMHGLCDIRNDHHIHGSPIAVQKVILSIKKRPLKALAEHCGLF